MADDRVAAKQPPYINGPHADDNSIACVKKDKISDRQAYEITLLFLICDLDKSTHH